MTNHHPIGRGCFLQGLHLTLRKRPTFRESCNMNIFFSEMFCRTIGKVFLIFETMYTMNHFRWHIVWNGFHFLPRLDSPLEWQHSAICDTYYKSLKRINAWCEYFRCLLNVLPEQGLCYAPCSWPARHRWYGTGSTICEHTADAWWVLRW